jgi:hypothetical protein
LVVVIPRAILPLFLLALPALAAAEVEVVSGKPDSVSVTIYRDLFALVTETRTVELPAEAHTLAFDNVVETLIPASAVLGELGRALLERNYDYESLAPANLLRRSIGREVTLTRVLPGSGKVTQTTATIAAASDGGIILRTLNGNEALNCSGLPERLAFSEVPGDLHPTPRLSVRLAAGTPGKRTLRLSYLAQGFAWRSDYVAQIGPAGNRAELTGWATLRNLTRTSLQQANVQLVAGRLNLIYDEDGGSSTIGATADFEDETELQDARNSRLLEMEEEQEAGEDLAFLQGCYPLDMPKVLEMEQLFQRERRFGGRSHGYSDELEEVVVTGLRASLLPPEALADYYLYRIPWPTDLNARQTKQAVFLQKPRVKIDRFYSLRLDLEEELQDEWGNIPLAPSVKIGFRNDRSSGLGEPLPAGMLRVFERDGERSTFAGESQLGDKPVGNAPIELEYAQALDLAVEVVIDDDPEDFDEDDAEAVDVTFQVANAKARPVKLEIRQALPDYFANARVTRSSQRPKKKFGDYTWQLKVAPNSVDTLDYRLVSRDEDEEAAETGDEDDE